MKDLTAHITKQHNKLFSNRKFYRKIKEQEKTDPKIEAVPITALSLQQILAKYKVEVPIEEP